MRSLETLIVVVVLTILSAAPVLANGSQLVFGDSVEYLWAEAQVLQEGRVPATSAFALTRQELYSTVLREELPEAPASSNDFIFSLTPYYSAFHTPYSSFSTNTNDMVYLHEVLPPIFELGDAFSLGDWMHAELVIDQNPPYRFMAGDGSFAPWHIGDLIGLEFPKHGYLSLALPQAGIAAGRFKSGLGYGHFGNTFLNSRAPFYDQVQFTYYNKYFKFFYMLGSSATHLSASEYQAQIKKDWDTINDHDASLFDDPVKMFAYHRVELRPFDWASFGVSEMNIVGGKVPNFNHINPFAIWHNTYTAGCSNVMFMLDATVVPVKGLQVYGEFTVDDVMGFDEDTTYGKPRMFAWQYGAKYVLPFWTETKHTIGAEFTHVDPWTYNRWQPYLTMYQRIVTQGGWGGFDVPLGFAYGGDLNHYGVYYTVVNRDGLHVEAGYEHLDKGDIYLGLRPDGTPYFVDYNQYNEGPFREGTVVEQRDTISLSVAYPLPWNLELNVRGSYSWINNFGHVQDAKESIYMFTGGLKWSF